MAAAAATGAGAPTRAVVCSLYRHILRGLREYPSRNREALVVSVKEEFHAHKEETDAAKVKNLVRDARMGLHQIEQYVGLAKTKAPDMHLKVGHKDSYVTPSRRRKGGVDTDAAPSVTVS